jgi:trk system potassium uptake protein TrkH
MEGRRGAWLAFLRTLLRLGTGFALAGLVVDFGLPIDEVWRGTIRTGQLVLVVLFAVHTGLELAWTRDRRRFLRHHWLEVGLFSLIVADVSIGIWLERRGPLAGAWFFGVQAYLVVRLLLSVAYVQEWFSRRTLRPALWLLASFTGLSLVGAGLLLLPRSRADGAGPWTLTDAFFTATSAVCVTGLSVRDIGTELSFRGQALLLGLIQVGGLGLVAIACGTAFLQRGNLTLRESRILGEAIGFSSPGRLRRFLVFAIAFTLFAETVGAVGLWFAVEGRDLGEHNRLWWSVFHSVSAFCNAGFSLSRTSLAPFAGDAAVLGIVAALIVIGGLGFAVHMDLLGLRPVSLATLRWLRWRLFESVSWPWRHAVFQGECPPRLALSSRLVLTTTGILFVAGTLMFLASESGGALRTFGIGQMWLTSAFASVTARTAGFQTVDPSAFAGPTLLGTILLMVVGASPLSTGGGVKTSTLAVAALTLRSMTRNRDQVEAYGRSIPRQVVNACVAITALYALAASIVTTALLATQRDLPFESAVFESVSALSTVGLSMDVTPHLDTAGRWIVAAAMIAGRIGPLACLWSFISRGRALRYRYPNENVIIS